MGRKQLMLYVLTTVLSSGLATGNMALAQRPASTVTASQAATQLTVNQITQQIAELEVKRALLQATFTSESPYIQDIEQKLQSLRKNLVQIQPIDNNAAVTLAVSEAIKAKIGELEVERTLLNATYTATSPVIQDKQRKLQSLKKRFVQIQPQNKSAIAVAVSVAIKAKIRELKAERTMLETKYSPTHPKIEHINSQLRTLEKRLLQG